MVKKVFLKLPILRIITWIVSLALFLAALGFAVKNSELVTLHYYLGASWQAPLVLLLFIAFVLGAVAGVAASFSYVYRLRREILGLKRRERRSRARIEAEK